MPNIDARCVAPASARVLIALLAFTAPALAATHSVPDGGDLQAALNAAQPGDTILLQTGATYTGNFTLSVKAGAGWIVVRTGGADRDLPAAGTRITPAHARLLAKIQSPSTAPAVTTAAGAHHWRFECVELMPNAKGSGDIVRLGAGDSTQTEVAQMPRDLVFDRVYMHGDPSAGQKRGIALNSGRTQIINSHFSDFKALGQDSQAVAGWNGSGPYLIENNYIEAAGENVMFGGADPAVWNNVPSDITVRRNFFTKPVSWRQEKWSVKNAFELKSGRRVLIEGNIFEHVWQGGQPGYAVLFTVRNQDGKAPWSVIEDVTFRYNIIRNAAAAINLTGYDNNHPSDQTRRVRIAHNLIYGIDKARWGGNGDFVQIGNAPRDVIIEHNTVWHTGNALHLYGRNASGLAPIEGVVFRDNLLPHNSYGVIGDGSGGVGNPSIAAYLPGVIFERNVLAGGPPSRYPAGNYFPSVQEFEAQFANPANEDFALVAGSAFRSGASDGGALGADLATLQRVMTGAPSAAPSPAPAQDGSADADRWEPRAKRPRLRQPD